MQPGPEDGREKWEATYEITGTESNLLDGPFLGRTAEFGTLIEHYQHAHAGRPQLVVLQGESGVGKTRLADEFVCRAQAQGADVLPGKALQTGSELKYQPFMDVLRHRLEQDHGSEGPLSEVWLTELARLLPYLRRTLAAHAYFTSVS